jgi:hypothetical protein
VNRQGDFGNPVVLGILCIGIVIIIMLVIAKFRGGDGD